MNLIAGDVTSLNVSRGAEIHFEPLAFLVTYVGNKFAPIHKFTLVVSDFSTVHLPRVMLKSKKLGKQARRLD